MESTNATEGNETVVPRGATIIIRGSEIFVSYWDDVIANHVEYNLNAALYVNEGMAEQLRDWADRLDNSPPTVSLLTGISAGMRQIANDLSNEGD